MEERFILKSTHKPAGDQPKAIASLVKGVKAGERDQTLLGVTGSGKTFTAANVIAQIQKPTLVIAHNKTLAAQLTQEYREFFPDNAVHFFVSYYDFYQPEAYMPVTDTYIEKEAMINKEIERLRHACTQALLTRRDVIVVASVSCIYGLGNPEEYQKGLLSLEKGAPVKRAQLIRDLVSIYFTRTTADLTPGTFRALGTLVEIMPVNEQIIYRIDTAGDVIQNIVLMDSVTRSIKEEPSSLLLFPAKHFVTPEEETDRALKDIKAELNEQLTHFKRAGKVLEHERLKRRTTQDIAMIREIGYTNGIENYSRHFDGRKVGEPPYTLLSYFPRIKTRTSDVLVPDFLTIIDESHVTVPQIGGMYAGDQARKKTLIEHGFRLPSAADNRPLMFDEFEERIGQTIYTSATPGKYELEHSKNVVQQVIRPTGLVDPEIDLRPVTEKSISGHPMSTYPGQVADFIAEAEKVVKRGGRVMVTTLTKKMSEDLSEYLKGKNIKAEYLHSDVKTIDRIEILTNLRKGNFDVLVGVNLLREGLDLPEVELVAIMDADKEGFLRSETSLIQTIGRAARNVQGRVVLYADTMTNSLTKAVGETNRRRAIQIAYNKEHGITPTTVKKNIKDITEELRSDHNKAVGALLTLDAALATDPKSKKALIADKKRQMEAVVEELDFETAALLRDEIKALEASLPEPKKRKEKLGRVYLEDL